MLWKSRIESGGVLYHIISRGNNRRIISCTSADYLRFTQILEHQKSKLPFYLYACCLMPNHFHLLIEMQDDPISRIMQRVLTSYSQFHNRKYKKVGHLFQGRYKSILCQTDQYLAELVRYIHLNPVRAKMVKRAERYPYSSNRAYVGTDRSSLVDSEPVLRHFGHQRGEHSRSISDSLTRELARNARTTTIERRKGGCWEAENWSRRSSIE